MRIIVTGCGGFLGSEIVRQLIGRGDEVVGLSRGDYPPLRRIGMTAIRGDLTDIDFVRASIIDADAVIHTAAKAGAWGSYDGYHQVNTVATEHIIDACRRSNIGALVHCSSPSVTFAGDHQRGVDESEPYPDKFLCAYPQTKMLAEIAVLAADRTPTDGGGSLRTIALRPHLIWGVGDPHLAPRVIGRAAAGKLRIVGHGNNRVDMVHVANAAAAHRNALDALIQRPDDVGGRPFFITDDDPVDCWQWIDDLCSLAGVAPPPRRRVPYRVAYAAGAALEMVYRLTGRSAEPPMTRFVAAQLAKDHYFDITAAKTLLGYRPIKSRGEGWDEMAQMFATSTMKR